MRLRKKCALIRKVRLTTRVYGNILSTILFIESSYNVILVITVSNY